jgi:hypothetical protein
MFLRTKQQVFCSICVLSASIGKVIGVKRTRKATELIQKLKNEKFLLTMRYTCDNLIKLTRETYENAVITTAGEFEKTYKQI